MKVITQHISPPVPTDNCDWVAYFEGQEEDGPRGYGKTERIAINELFDVTDVDDLAIWFDITAREFGTSFEDYYWVASTDDGTHVASPWRDCAISDLAYKLSGAAR